MKLVPNKMIQVYNYSPTQVVVKGTNREYLIPGARTMGPGVEFLSSDDVKYINSRSPVFKFGMLEFSDDDREEIYNELGMPNWKDTVLFERDIDNILLHPTKESLQMILDAKNISVVERIRGHMIGLVNAGEDVSSRVIKLVNERSTEISRHPSMPSKIKLVEKDYSQEVTQETVAALMAELAEMKKKLEEREITSMNEVANPVKSSDTPKPASKKTSTSKRQSTKKTTA